MEPSGYTPHWPRVMLRIVLIFIPLLAVAALTGYVTGMRGVEKARVEASQPAGDAIDQGQIEETGGIRPPLGTSPDTSDRDEAQGRAGVPYPPRNVTPPGIHTGPIRSYEPESAAPEGQPVRATRTFHRVVVEAAGRLRATDTEIRLAGIAAPAPGDTCTSTAEEEWPCGMAARTALRQLVRNRAVECDIIDEAGDALVGDCRVGSRPLSAWLVEQGWAEPEDGRYQDAAEAARAEERGMFTTATEDVPVPLPVSADGGQGSQAVAE